MKTKSVRIVLFALGSLLGASLASAQQYDVYRGNHSEFYLLIQYWTMDGVTLPGVTLPGNSGVNPPMVTGDIHYKLDSQVFWGFGFAYHFNERMALHAELAFGNPDYTMTFQNATITGSAHVNTGKVNFDYYLMKGPVTPFVSVGGGYMYFDSGVPSGPTDYWIWWDYFWGPIVVASQPTFSETYWTYNAAGGVRWEVSDRFAMKLSYGGNWVDVGGHAGTMLSTETSLTFDWKF